MATEVGFLEMPMNCFKIPFPTTPRARQIEIHQHLASPIAAACYLALLALPAEQLGYFEIVEVSA